jgi:hypothetical protein
LTVVAARPKVGKSILTMQAAIAVATGQRFLDQFETQPGRVLVYDADDGNKRRAQDRLVDLGGADMPDRLLLFRNHLQAGQKGIDNIDAHLSKFSKEGSPIAMVVIDCLMAIAGQTRCRPRRYTSYAERTQADGWVPSIDSLLGTSGLSSVIDSAITIENTRQDQHRIYFSARDLFSPEGLVLRKDKGGRTG